MTIFGEFSSEDSSFETIEPTPTPTPTKTDEVIIKIPFFRQSVPALWAMFALATLFVVLATLISCHLIYKHLKYYTQPDHQRYIVRIVFMIPIYAIYSLLCLFLHRFQVYFSLLRDCYEAYVLYMFFALCVNYGGGDKNLVTHFISHPVMRLPFPLNFIKVKPNENFLQVCRVGMLQYVFLRPFITLLSAIFEIFDLYDEGSYAPNRFYLYNSITINLSVTVALYIIVLFSIAAKEELAPYKPLLKFTSIKIVVFFCFWQSVAISGMTNFGWIPSIDGWSVGQISMGLQNFLICFEMFGVAILHIYAFPYELYRVRAFSAAPLIHRVEMGTVLKSVMNSVSQKDMVNETLKATKGTRIAKGVDRYEGLENREYNEFDVEAIELGEFQSYDNQLGSIIIDEFQDNQSLNGASLLHNNKKDHAITDEDFFSMMNNDFTNIDLSNFDQQALEDMNFDDDDDDLLFTARR
ncbi:transmembrane protein [Tieghemostelium lacteum]|uniref:Transmembrane protein n=1 Tax=Tieghemostelium lacteum TaxID=361077 RepID=A0A151Z6F4_TIELA|nr:transmembrane protein [Tieghemostelium lacteum]|eukprot:KYQ89540.1 transmembrane protein [Tieghemostelium lacteum]